MMIQFYNMCWFFLAQTQVGEGAAGAAGEAVAEVADKPKGFLENMGFMFPALMAVMLLYFIMMTRPKQNAPAKPSELLSKLKKNDRVVTAGGILGTVVNVRADDEFVTLRVDDSSSTRMQVLGSSIVRVVSDEDTKKS
jgi:preprotein translocase subunit YajC